MVICSCGIPNKYSTGNKKRLPHTRLGSLCLSFYLFTFEGKKRHIARALDGNGELTLTMRAATARACGYDLALFGHILSETGYVLVINNGYTLLAKFANLSLLRAANLLALFLSAEFLAGRSGFFIVFHDNSTP